MVYLSRLSGMKQVRARYRWETLTTRILAAALLTSLVTVGHTAPAMSRTRSPAPPSRPVLPISERFARADAYLRPQIDTLIANADLAARFTSEGAGVIYHIGHAGARTVMYIDLASGRAHRVADERQIARWLAQATRGVVDPVTLALDAINHDAASDTLSFDVAGTRWTLTRGGVLQRAGRDPADADGSPSPDGRYRVIARDLNLFAQDVKTRREVALTVDRTREQPYGRGIPPMAEILKQGTEEPKLPVSVRWSPDSRSIATWRLDTREVPRLSITQEIPPDSFYLRSFHYIYPLAGAPRLPQATRYAVNVERALESGRATLVPLAIPPEALLYPADPDINWRNGRIRAQWTERGYRQLVVYDADPATGAARITAREAVKPVVTVTSGFLQPAPELGGVLAVSERSGWAQLYLIRPDDPDGSIPLTQPFFWRKLRDYFTRHLLDEKPPSPALPGPAPVIRPTGTVVS